MNTDSSMDFKYLIQDFSWYYIGARMTYDEMVDLEDMPGRFRTAVFRYMEDETDMDKTLAEHLLTMDRGSRSAMIYERLRALFTILPNPEKGRMKQEIIKAEDFFDDEQLRQSLFPREISEVRFKKKNLMFLRV
ncbi:MAG: hypothetical protein K6E84_06140 [Lachnospiraceae bacterium]|nr:hypothetical protein [Lachnospiraceae bacterium]